MKTINRSATFPDGIGMKQRFLVTFAAILSAVNVFAYSFSDINEDGVTLYYEILNPWAKTCAVVYGGQTVTTPYNPPFIDTLKIPSTAHNSRNHDTYSVVAIGEKAFSWFNRFESVIIPESVTTIGNSAFKDCVSLKSVEIPEEGLTSMGDNAFAGCKQLASFEIPKTVTEIGRFAFYECSSLTTAVIPDGIEWVEDYTFYKCSSLTSVKLGASVWWIGEKAFYNCTNLTKIDIPSSVSWIGEEAFSYCESLISIVLPDSLTSIEDGMFFRCYALKSVEIPNSVNQIGKNVFSYCRSLLSIKIPDSVTKIGDNVFRECRNLASVVIGESVSEIGVDAFYWCIGLDEITSLNPVPPTIKSNTFADFQLRQWKVYVPDESVDAYKTAEYWKDFENIVGLSNSGIQNLEAKNDITISATPNGLRISGTTPGETISVYSIDGRLVAKATATDEVTEIQCSANVVIVKIGNTRFAVTARFKKLF